MAKEYESLQRNKTWVLVKKPENKKVVGCRWIFKKMKESQLKNLSDLKPDW